MTRGWLVPTLAALVAFPAAGAILDPASVPSVLPSSDGPESPSDHAPAQAQPARLLSNARSAVSGLSEAVEDVGSAPAGRDGEDVPGARLKLTFEESQGTVSWLLKTTPGTQRWFHDRAGLLPSLDDLRVVVPISARGTLSAPVQDAKLRLFLASTNAPLIEVTAALYVNDQKVAEGDDIVFLYPSIYEPQDVRWMRWAAAEILFDLPGRLHAETVHLDLRVRVPPGAQWFLRTDGASGLSMS
ncbi:MAG TPA: hypothetical protein VM681_00390 [Candidatus Thermoplasmatota archaeon]|nr:hypothetical protein [Candidatus Thermoplasmatota archaeon]